MKGRLLWLRIAMLAALAWSLVSVRGRAQSPLAFSVSASADSVAVNTPLTYTVSITNLSLSAIQNVYVTNVFSAPFQFVGVTNYYYAAYTGAPLTNSTTVSLLFLQINPGDLAQVTVTVSPTTAGSFTNSATLSSFYLPNVLATNLATQITNGSGAQADLAVTITGPTQAVITNDLMTYAVAVTNSGPADASGVVLSNTLPPGVSLVGITPRDGTLVSNLGTLTNGESRRVAVTVQPTNSGPLTFAASVSSAATTDPDPTNNAGNLTLNVANYLPGKLVATNLSAQIFDPQTGLMEQTIRVTNAGTNPVDAARVVVGGLTNLLYNAMGTNGANPFVVYAAALNPGQSADLLLEYFVPAGLPVPNPQWQVFPLPAFSLSPPAPAGAPVSLSHIVRLPNGNMLIEFSSVTNRAYTIVYGSDASFSDAKVALPSVTAPANRMQWIDYGPPTTLSRPSNTVSRFYRVFSNP